MLVDGVDVRDVTRRSLRREIGVISQDPFLFSATVRENIAFGVLDATEEQILRAALAAQAHEFVEELPQGYDTVIGERGITLSGGQRQRLAIARALVIDPRILILDDATASVDATTEAKIRTGLAEAMRDRTTIIIAHRLSTIALADEVVVLDHGRIMAHGTQAELLATNAVYQEIHEHGLLQGLLEGERVKVWQPGGHLSEERGGEVRDWSWRRTRRRMGVLARLTLPYKGRTALALGTLLAFTLVALAPPYLAKLAIDEGIESRDLTRLTWIVVLFLGAAVVALALSAANTYLTGWTGERVLADLRNKLFAHLARLSLGFYERNRAGVIISRITNDVEALDQLVTDGVTSLVQNTLLLLGTAVVLFFLDVKLALATLTVLALDGDRDRVVPQPLQPRLPQRPRAARPRHGHARRGHRRDARRPVVHARAGAAESLPRRERPLPRSQLRDDGSERDLLPGRRPARVGRDRDRLRLRRLARLPRRDDRGHPVRLRALPLELLRPDPAALAALQHVPLRHRRAGQDHRRARRGAAGRRSRPTRPSCRESKGMSGSTTSASATGRSSRRCCTGSSSTSRPARPSRSSATPAPASRRSRS